MHSIKLNKDETVILNHNGDWSGPVRISMPRSYLLDDGLNDAIALLKETQSDLDHRARERDSNMEETSDAAWASDLSLRIQRVLNKLTYWEAGCGEGSFTVELPDDVWKSLTEVRSPTRRLEEWKNGGKDRHVSLSIENGYGATCWKVNLYHSLGCTTASEVSLFSMAEEAGGQREYQKLARERGYVFVPEAEDVDWPGLGPTIHTAIDAFEEGVWGAREPVSK